MAARWWVLRLLVIGIIAFGASAEVRAQSQTSSNGACVKQLTNLIAEDILCQKVVSCYISIEQTYDSIISLPDSLGFEIEYPAQFTRYVAAFDIDGVPNELTDCTDFVLIGAQLTPMNSTNGFCAASNSTINIDTAALSESVNVVGVPFQLNYSSDRFRQGFSFSTKTLGLGGWTPTIVHHFDVANKILYTGDGGLRPFTAQAKGAGFYLAGQDGSEVYNFDANGVHQSTQDGLTGLTKFTMTYDGSGRLITIADAFGNTTTFQYSSGQVAVTAPFGQNTRLGIDVNGFLSSVTSPGTATFAMTYDSSGNLLSFQKPLGQTSAVTYDSSGFVLKDTGAGGDYLSLLRTFDSASQTQTVTTSTAMGRQTIYQTTAPSTSSSTHGVTDPDGGSSSSSDNNDGPDSSTDSLGENDNSTLMQDPRFSWMSPYSSLDAQTVTGSNINVQTQTTKTATLTNPADPFSFSTLTTTTMLQNDPTRTFVSTYTASNKTTITTSPVGRVVTSALNPQGQVQTIQNGSLAPANLNYDSHGRMTQLSLGTRNLGLTYDSSGNVQSSSDFLGHVTSFNYDSDGHVTKQTQPDGSVIQLTYDLNGNVTSITPPSRPAHVFNYNLFDLIASYLPPALGGQSATTYAYNLDKQLTQVNLPNGQVINYNYAATSGLLNSINTSTGNYSYTYDPNSNLISQLTSPDGEIMNYQYVGSILSGTTNSGPITSSLNFAFNPDSTLASVVPKDSQQNGVVQTLAYDKDGLIVGAGDLTMTRDLNGLVSTTTLKNVSENIGYNTFGEMTEDAFSLQTTIAKRVQKLNIYDRVFTRDNLGRITDVKHNYFAPYCSREFWGLPEEKYVYDSVGRLTEVHDNFSLVRKYVYDQNGNRIEKHLGNQITKATYDAQDRLLTYGNNTYNYDNNGTLIQKTVEDKAPAIFFIFEWLFGGPANGKVHDKITNYAFDAFGNLKSVTLPDGRIITYIIDGQNRRVGKLVNGKMVQGFIYQSQTQIAAELDGTGRMVKQFIYGTKSNTPDYMMMNGKEYRIISNQVGTPRYVIDASNGQVVEFENMDEFGYFDVAFGSSYIPFGFAGGIYDTDTGLVRFGARDYDPETGRFVSKDPTLFNGSGTNLYAYSVNDPVNFYDSNGKLPVPIITGIVGGIIGAGSGFTNSNSCTAGGRAVDTAIGATTGFIAGFLTGVGAAGTSGVVSTVIGVIGGTLAGGGPAFIDINGKTGDQILGNTCHPPPPVCK